MKTRSRFVTIAIIISGFVLGTAQVAQVDNPGAIAFTGNVDSHARSDVGGMNMYMNMSSGLALVGTVDSGGVMFFDRLDMTFDDYEDANGYRMQMQATDDAVGTFCPNTGVVTITMSARVRFTKYAGTSIATTPCYVTFDGNSAFELTTGTSGGLTGATFKTPSPALIAEVHLDATVSGATCPQAAKTAISNYYSLAGTPIGRVYLPGASYTPTNLTGTGC